jgi:hypothetical protein
VGGLFATEKSVDTSTVVAGFDVPESVDTPPVVAGFELGSVDTSGVVAAFGGHSLGRPPRRRTAIPTARKYALAVSRRTPVRSSMDLSEKPRSPSATTCCLLSSLKTLLIPVQKHSVSAPVNVPGAMRGGRFSGVHQWPVLGVHRGLAVTSQADSWELTGEDPLTARAAHFLASRCHAEWLGPAPVEQLQGWDHDLAAARATRVREEFERPELRPFDVGHWFWGSWKWVGGFATEFSWIGRWIMHSVVTRDTRAVNLCADVLQQGTVGEQQSQALRYSLSRLTGRSFATDREWVDWYFAGGGIQQYPEPDFKQWHADLKEQLVIAEPGAARDHGGATTS